MSPSPPLRGPLHIDTARFTYPMANLVTSLAHAYPQPIEHERAPDLAWRRTRRPEDPLTALLMAVSRVRPKLIAQGWNILAGNHAFVLVRYEPGQPTGTRPPRAPSTPLQRPRPYGYVGTLRSPMTRKRKEHPTHAQ